MVTNITKNIYFEPRHEYSHLPDVNKEYDVIIVGLGVAGYASAMYASRLGLSVLLIGEQPGGTLALVGMIENYPGFVSIPGQELTDLLENHAMDYPIDIDIDIVTKIEKDVSKFIVRCQSKTYVSKTVILTTGAKVKPLGVKGETSFFQKGVSYCALCDAAFIQNKDVAVVGGGDSAVKEAVLLSQYAKKVYIINSESSLHPEEHNNKALQNMIEKGQVEVFNDNSIVEIQGSSHVKSLLLEKSVNGSKRLFVSNVFIYIGRIPSSALAKDVGVTCNEKGEVIINSHSETNIKGFFAAGDVTNVDWKQAIIGVSQGVTASYYAYQLIRDLQ